MLSFRGSNDHYTILIERRDARSDVTWSTRSRGEENEKSLISLMGEGRRDSIPLFAPRILESGVSFLSTTSPSYLPGWKGPSSVCGKVRTSASYQHGGIKIQREPRRKKEMCVREKLEERNCEGGRRERGDEWTSRRGKYVTAMHLR